MKTKRCLTYQHYVSPLLFSGAACGLVIVHMIFEFSSYSRLPPQMKKVSSTSNTALSCKHLLHEPLPFNYTACRPVDQRSHQCTDGLYHMTSQHSQDFYLFTKHFKYLKRRGEYLDLAAHHAVQLSNTWFMDECLGWKGTCIEANPKYFRSLDMYRSCDVVRSCVSDRDGRQVSFVFSDAAGGIVETHKSEVVKKKAPLAETLKCTSLATILNRASKRRTIDYFSLDIEGHEFEVLNGIDWNATTFNVISIEVSRSTIGKISQFLTERQYVRHFPTLSEETLVRGIIGQDIIFLHESVHFGSPE